MYWGCNMDLFIPNKILMYYTQDLYYTLIIDLGLEIEHFSHNYFVAYYKVDLIMCHNKYFDFEFHLDQPFIFDT